MSINTIGGNPAASEQARGNQGPQAPGEGRQQSAERHDNQSASASDSVQISSSAVDLQALEARIGKLPEVDSARVSELREQIARGEYQIDGQQVAARLIDFESVL